MRDCFKNTFILCFIIILGFIYNHKYINEFPSHIHAWAQSDRYALALGFIDNGLNFFKPQTMVYNHQFPDKWKAPSPETITAVDFPIHDYIPALLMKISGNTSPWVFRLYVLLYSFLGLLFLFKLSFIITGNYIKSVFVVLFTATSPVYVYYQAGFLPTIPSLSNAIIGIYFYYIYLSKNQNKYFWLSILLLTLAALSRTTFAIAIVAVLAIEFIRLLKHETKLLPKIAPVGISIFAILLYLLYNVFLRQKYGSLFLNHILPPKNLNHAYDIIKIVYQKWFFQYFTKPHYITIIAIFLLSVYFIVIKKTCITKIKIYFSLLTIIYLFGCIIFAFLMIRQFPAHDYYFLDSFFLPVVMLLLLLFSLIPNSLSQYVKLPLIGAVCVVSCILISKPIKTQQNRRVTGYWDKTGATINNFKNSSGFFDSLGISKEAKILVIDAVAPNIPFIQMQRKGFAVMTTSAENIEEALKWDFNYIVFQNEYFITDIYTPYPGILTKLNKVADNGKISVCTLSHNNKQSLISFLGLSKKQPVFKTSVTFETQPDSLWSNINPTSKNACTGNSSGHLTPDIVYGLTYKSKHLPVLQNNSRTILFSSHFITDTVTNTQIVVSVIDNGQNIYYKTYNLKNLINQKGEWAQVSLIFQLPKIQSNDYEFSIFIWNTGKSELFYDNFGFSIY